MYLYHYFDRVDGPFRNLSDCSLEEANRVLDALRSERPGCFAAARRHDYFETRINYERIAARLFAEKGGVIRRGAPHYMVVEACPWLYGWYENPAFVRIHIDDFDVSTLSFTYGDMHPTLSPRVCDGKVYRKQVYTYDEILRVIAEFGLPQDWNADGTHGPERYVEVQVWCDDPVDRFAVRDGV